jgi:mono/diheme cytochrome c family protein
MRRLRSWWVPVVLLAVACGRSGPRPGSVQDEAMRAGRTPEQFPAASEDYFHEMDANVVDGRPVRALTPQEIEGRNMWLVWTGGDDRLWDRLTVDSLGTFDLLKTISSHPAVKYDDPHQKAGEQPKYLYGYGRHNRFAYLGLVNEPCFSEATGPDPSHFGLWLDQRKPGCPRDPFADPARYPGVQIGARGKTVAVGSYYGEPTGIVGLRLFPNPDFDEPARQHWNAERFYNDPSYYYDPKLVRPYRVGMSCAFCHVGPNPIRPPANAEEPAWENLSSNVGAQYFWWDRVFNWRGDAAKDGVFYQALHVSRPGTLDTSLVSTDNINNPRTMNAVYYLLPRMAQARKWGRETIAGGGLYNKQFNNYVPPGDPLAQFFAAPSTTWTPRVLKDGSDSVGALGALNRVYLNIGLFSEEWLLHFRAVIGGQPISPIPIETAERNSVYWRATENQTPNMARFFLATTDPHKLRDAPGGAAYLVAGGDAIGRGKVVFAERCARCHSTKLPDLPTDLDLEAANGPRYLAAWNQYWAWTKTDAFKARMREIVADEHFLDGNYLSSELRVPVTLLGINACSPIATNAIRDNIWDNFSSESYKSLPSAGSIEIRHPVTGAKSQYPLPAGGRGYIRPASLVSLWSTSPFLQNNTVGYFDPDPSVDSRMSAFSDAISQMLYPETRDKDDIFKNESGPGVGKIDRITDDSYLDVPEAYVPPFLRPLVPLSRALVPSIGGSGKSLSIGPFPRGFPIGLVTNTDLLGADLSGPERRQHTKNLLALVDKAKAAVKTERDFAVIANRLVDDMLAVSKCKDFVVNKGHYFGTSYFAEEPPLNDWDKYALIEFLKTF